MKDTTIVIVALVVTGVFASALTVPQLILAPSVNSGSSYYQNRNPQMGGGMMGADMMGGMMRPDMMGSMPMMKGMMGYYSGTPNPLSHSEVTKVAKDYLTSLNNKDLTIDEFEEYSHNFYVSIVEKNTGRGAIEIIVDRYGGNLQPEPQSMMWNSKYGMMGGSQEGQINVTPEEALKIAQDFLDVVYPRTKTGEIVAFYGYYTIMTTLDGGHYGMLSVNGYSGEVWYHTWHGMFISEVEE